MKTYSSTVAVIKAKRISEKKRSNEKLKRSLFKAFGEYYVDYHQFLEETKLEVELLRWSGIPKNNKIENFTFGVKNSTFEVKNSTFEVKNSINEVKNWVHVNFNSLHENKIDKCQPPKASTRYLLQKGYTKPVTFTSEDLTDTKTLYFQEDQEIPDCVKFDILNDEYEAIDVETSRIEEFNIKFHDKFPDSSHGNKFILRSFDKFSVLDSAILERLSKLHFASYEKLLDLKESYKRKIVESDNFENILKKIARHIFSKCRNVPLSKAHHSISLDRVITPKLFYTYPIDDEHKGLTPMSWPLLQRVA